MHVRIRKLLDRILGLVLSSACFFLKLCELALKKLHIQFHNMWVSPILFFTIVEHLMSLDGRSWVLMTTDGDVEVIQVPLQLTHWFIKLLWLSSQKRSICSGKSPRYLRWWYTLVLRTSEQKDFLSSHLSLIWTYLVLFICYVIFDSLGCIYLGFGFSLVTFSVAI